MPINCNNIKDFSKELQVIGQFKELATTPVSVINDEGKFICEGIVTKYDNKMRLEVPVCISNSSFKNIRIKSKAGNLFFTDLDIVSQSTTVNKSGNASKIVYLFRYLKNNTFSSNYVSVFSCYIPVKPSKLHTFYYQLETILYADSYKIYGYDCVRINIGDIQFDVLQIKSEQSGYYVIESFQNMSFKVFRDYCFAIQQALGFIMGYMPGGEIFYITKSSDFYYTNYIRPAMDTVYIPIDTNPYHFIEFKGTIAESYSGKLNVMPANIFSKLVAMIYSDLRFSTVMLMLIESEYSHSFVLGPSLYAIILESLTKIINTSEVKEKRPVNQKLFRKISRDIERAIDVYTDQCNYNDDIQKLKRRIPELNKTIRQNYLSNDEKLLQPFEQLGIELTSIDSQIIKHRNDLLHGNTCLIENDHTEICDINNYLLYVSGKLYTLISSLILKYVGYNGYIINHAKSCEKYCHIETNQDYYKQI